MLAAYTIHHFSLQISEAATQSYSCEKMFWKYAANLQENLL